MANAKPSPTNTATNTAADTTSETVRVFCDQCGKESDVTPQPATTNTGKPFLIGACGRCGAAVYAIAAKR